MRITHVELGQTYNLGDYESCKISLRAAVDEGETAEDVALALYLQTYEAAKKLHGYRVTPLAAGLRSDTELSTESSSIPIPDYEA